MNNKEKVKYILNNFRKAKAKGRNLVESSKKEYSLQAKVSVRGGRQPGRSDSEQEKYISKKEENKEKGESLIELSESIDFSVKSLPQRKRIIIRLKYFEELTEKEIGKIEKINRTPRQVRRIEEDALELLAEYGLQMIYQQLEKLLS